MFINNELKSSPKNSFPESDKNSMKQYFTKFLIIKIQFTFTTVISGDITYGRLN